MSPIRDPALYRRLAEPTDEATAAERQAAFFQAVRAAREANGIVDVVFVATVNVTDAAVPGGERSRVTVGQIGDDSQAPRLAATLYVHQMGSASERLEQIAGAVSVREER
jgi:hypothetical protein